MLIEYSTFERFKSFNAIERKSEFLGCMSFAVNNCLKKGVNGWYRLLSQSSGRLGCVPYQLSPSSLTLQEEDNAASLPYRLPAYNRHHQQPDVMANQSESSIEELISVDDSDVPPTPEAGSKERKRLSSSKKDYGKVIEDYIFLRYLELDPPDETGNKRGRTPFTATRSLKRHPGTSYGFSIAWTHPPRVERVESGLPADQAGLRPGDYIIFVDKHNVVTMKEEEILEIIKACGNQLVMESYRKAGGSTGGGGVSGALTNIGVNRTTTAQHRPPTACSAATTTVSAAAEATKKRLHLPHVAFSSESNSRLPFIHGSKGIIGEEDVRKRNLYQLVEKEQNFVDSLQFGTMRFLLPLGERKDLILASEHSTLFQNIQELLRISEDILELFMQDDALWNSVGKIYFKKVGLINNCYRRYWVGLKKAYSMLVEKVRHSGFNKFITEPAVPRRRPDLISFLHRPVEHFREILKQLQLIMNSTKVRNEDYIAMTKVVHEMQANYREMTTESGLMEPDGEGRPLLSLLDLESRLVFTRCKPFTLNTPGRQWIFGGDLSRIEGRSVRQFWALLFTDLLVFAKVSRDRVLFVTEEPLQLSTINQALFSIRKKATEFRLLISNKSEGGEDSPAMGVCAELTRTPKKGPRKRTVALRAPTPELKHVWQNLIQRQILYISSGRGGTPASSPMDSPDPMTADSLDSICAMKKQQQQQQTTEGLSELIENRCKQLGKTGLSRGSALHLSQWMRGELGGGLGIGGSGDITGSRPEVDTEPDLWSAATLRLRQEEIKTSIGGGTSQEDFHASDPSIKSTDESQRTVKSTAESPEKMVAVCRKCQKTCLLNSRNNAGSHSDGDINANRCGNSGGWSTAGGGWSLANTSRSTAWDTSSGVVDPFSPLPEISVMPPSPTVMTSSASNNNNSSVVWHDSNFSRATHDDEDDNHSKDSYIENGDESDDDLEEPPYRSLSPCGLKRYGTVSSLEHCVDQSSSDACNNTSLDDDDEPTLNISPDTTSQFEYVSQSIRGWTLKAGSFVAEKISFFDKSDESSKCSFVERYLKGDSKGTELMATTTNLAGEEECETSGATSENDVWGTPTSGGSELTSPNTENADSPVSSLDESEQLLMEQLLGGGGLMGVFAPHLAMRGNQFTTRTRLEPLPEDIEEESSSSTTTPEVSEAANSCNLDQGTKSDGCPSRARSAASTPRFLDKLKLRRSQSADSRPTKPKRFMGFLRTSKSEEHTSSSSGRNSGRLMRLFSRECSQDDIPTSLPADHHHHLAHQKQQQEKPMEKRFWKQLYKRRSSGSVKNPGLGT